MKWQPFLNTAQGSEFSYVSRLPFSTLLGAYYVNEDLEGKYERPFSLTCIYFLNESSKYSSCYEN
jgi:hypothetical protein